MFEKILQPIINKFAGDYIEGFDAKNLNVGIWSGNIVIEKVALKSGLLDQLEMPLKILFSRIGRLVIKLPWKNLGNSPIEITLEDLYIVVGPKTQKEWTFKDYKGLKTKLEMLEKYARECIQKLSEATMEKLKKSSEEDAGFFEKLTIKIVDNIQLKI